MSEINIAGSITSRPPASVVVMADDGTELLRLSWDDGVLHAVGDESRWDEAAARFVAAMRALTGV